MRYWRITVLAFILVLGVPILALAAGPFYATNDGNAREDASGLTPAEARRALDMAGLTKVAGEFSKSLTRGETATLYWWLKSEKQYCTYTLLSDGSAVPHRCQDGDPPGTGVDLSPPLVVGSLVVLAVVLFGAGGFLLRRQQRAASA